VANLTRINNNQITDASVGNVYVGVNAAAKLQNYTITSQKIANNLTYGSDLTVTGNLTVQGTTTTIDTNITTIEDPVIILASNQTGAPAVDIGFIGQRGTSNNVAFVWDESATEFITAYTSTAETNTVITISSYANFHTNDANVAGNLRVGGTTSFTGNIASLNVTGNITGGNLLSPGLISATSTITSAANITGSNLLTGGLISATSTITSAANITGGNLLTGGLVSATANVIGGNIRTGGLITATSNITGGNLLTGGLVSATSNITGGNLLTGGLISAASTITGSSVLATVVSASGNITGGNLLTGGQAVVTGNITGGNVLTGGQVSATGNVTGGNLVAVTALVAPALNVTGNITGGNVLTAGQVSATGNVTGGNVITSGLTSTGSLTASTTIVATGNVTGGNVLTSGLVSATGNVNGGNLISAALVQGVTLSATGNITGGNISTTGSTITGTLETTGNALIGGNLIVQGNITYINIDDLRVEDPIIILGTGPNGAPLSTDDGMDRGVYMEWYKTGLGNAFMGWENSSGNILAATSVNFSGNNVVNVLQYGTFQAGNLYVESASVVGNVNGGNLRTAGQVSATANITGGNVLTGGQVSATGNVTGGNLVATTALVAPTLNVTGNITGGNILTGGLISATSTITSAANITGGNLLTGGLISSASTITGTSHLGSVVSVSANITGGNILTGGLISSASTITGTSHLGTVVSVSGNITGGNILTGGLISSASTITGTSHLGTVVSVSGNITGGNILTGGLISATSTITSAANITGGNILTGGLVSATGTITGSSHLGTVASLSGNVTGGNLLTGGLVSATSSGTFGNIVITGNSIQMLNAAGRITIDGNSADSDFAVNGLTANIFYVDAATSTASFGNATQTTNALVSFNATNSILMPVGNTGQRPATGVTGMLRFSTTENALEVYDNSQWSKVGVPNFTVIADQQFNGDGVTTVFTLSSSQTTNSCIVSINGIVQIPTIAYSVSGTTLTFTEAPQTADVIDVREITTTTTVTSVSNSSGNAVVGVTDTAKTVQVTGDLVPTGNATANLGSSTNYWKSLYVSGNTIYLGGLQLKESAANTFSVYSSDGTTPATQNFGTGNITCGNIINSNANGVGNIGDSTTYFNTVFAKATSAQYADLAEKYVADAAYAPGTVVVFGGNKEVTVSSTDADRAVAGVISTNPSYIMNGGLDAEFVATVALTGRVPTRVTGTVKKGDLMVSAGYGLARAEADPKVGTVIGKSLEDFDGNEGIIEVVVGRF